MSVVPRRRSIAPFALGAVLAVVMLSLSVEFGGPAAGPSGVGLHPLVATAPCPGSTLPHNYSGTVEVIDAPSLPAVSLNYTYAAVETTNTTGGVFISSVCAIENDPVDVHGGGGFNISIDPTPTINCTIPKDNQGTCVSFSGPYEQVTVTVNSSLPAGEFYSVSQNGTAFQVRIYPYLATVRLTPGGSSETYSPGGVDRFGAEPLTGAGTPTPVESRLAWSLAGSGWTFVGPPGGSEVNVTAASGAGIGNLTVLASLNASYGHLVASASVELVAVVTSISSASLNRTALDLGQSLSARLNGTGAAGYRYEGTVESGFGEPAQNATCTTTPGLGGTVAISCSATWVYTETGVAQPTVTVSNGYSSAVWEFPEVTVNPPPSLAFLPDPPVGYADEPDPIVLQAGPGTGTLPYAEACLSTGLGAPQCLDSPGPTWTFTPVYSAPGNYSVSAWTVDAAGMTRSARTVVRIVAPLAVDLSPSTGPGTAGTPFSLEAFVSGGDLPAHVWWNVTGVSIPVVSAAVAADGSVWATFVPASAGFVSVSVAVVDGLGTAATAVETVTIDLGSASEVVPVVLPASAPIRAGAPFAIAWQALDGAGDVVHDFASIAEIELAIVGSRNAAPGWVNASGVGPLASRLSGWFDVPAGAWIGGALNVSVTSRFAGAIQVNLVVAAALPSGTGSVGVVVLPDIDHLRLFDPRTALSGIRTNDTLWQVTDRFGNAATGASIVVTTSAGGSAVSAVTPVLSEASGATEAWVNFSIPSAWEGTVSVTDLAGDALLPAMTVPGLSGPWAYLGVLPLVLGAGVGAGGAVVARARSRTHRPDASEAPVDEEGELQRLAEGRATVVELVRRFGSLDLAGVATAWEPPPAPPDLADWIASLLTDGTLDATFGADGVARFCLGTGGGARAEVTVDLEAYDRGQVRRDAATAEWDADDD